MIRLVLKGGSQGFDTEAYLTDAEGNRFEKGE